MTNFVHVIGDLITVEPWVGFIILGAAVAVVWGIRR